MLKYTSLCSSKLTVCGSCKPWEQKDQRSNRLSQAPQSWLSLWPAPTPGQPAQRSCNTCLNTQCKGLSWNKGRGEVTARTKRARVQGLDIWITSLSTCSTAQGTWVPSSHGRLPVHFPKYNSSITCVCLSLLLGKRSNFYSQSCQCKSGINQQLSVGL